MWWLTVTPFQRQHPHVILVQALTRLAFVTVFQRKISFREVQSWSPGGLFLSCTDASACVTSRNSVQKIYYDIMIWKRIVGRNQVTCSTDGTNDRVLHPPDTRTRPPSTWWQRAGQGSHQHRDCFLDTRCNTLVSWQYSWIKSNQSIYLSQEHCTLSLLSPMKICSNGSKLL